MNLYASTLKGIQCARENKHRRLQEEMAAAAVRNVDKKSRGFRWTSVQTDVARRRLTQPH